ncbi:MAG: hemerythrin domain-containing protein [Actinomycetota bacterium]|nr:hemerythrin domain-containing protein [Actinomycetota bacterium]
MPTREQVQQVLQATGDYTAAAEVLAISPGQAYLIATGLPADGSDGVPHDPARRAGVFAGSTQHLVYRHLVAHNPTSDHKVHDWLKGLAAKDAPMRAAAARDAAPGEPTATEEDDIASVITRDHDQVDALLKVLKTIPGVKDGASPAQRSQRESVLDMITVALSKHEATEQEHLWPAVRAHLADGDELAEHALAQEQEGKDLLVKIGRTDADDPALDQLVSELETASYHHVAFEDRVLLKLGAALDREAQKSLGDKFSHAEPHAPTRPHRRAPKRPGGAVKAAGAAGAALDRLRDSAGERPAERRGKATEEALEDSANQQMSGQDQEMSGQAPKEETS